MPKTGWQEPARDEDPLLRLPKGCSMTPTAEVHELESVKGARCVRSVERTASIGKTPPPPTEVETSRVQHVEVPKEKVDSDVSSEVSSEVAVSNLDGTVGESGDDHGDAGDAFGAWEPTETPSIVPDGEATALPGTYDGLDDVYINAYSIKPSDYPFDQYPSGSSQQTPMKALRQGTESIRPHPTDPSKVIVMYHVTVDGKHYDQETEIPEVIPMLAVVHSSSGSVIFPDVEDSTVPRTLKSSPWTPVPGSSGHEWIRGEGDKRETWRINIFFRRLDQDTHAFEDIYVNVNHLKNVNPNDKKFRASYNKWVLQFARRQDANYTQKVARVHWNTAERRALLAAINTFCSKFGIHKFDFVEGCRMSTEQLQLMADAVNAAPNSSRLEPRGVDAVRGQITSAHNKSQPKNKAIFDLLVKALTSAPACLAVK
ncbi:hypothetical protein E8E12_000947 [Didymella heteroderae]|uniref:Uncharacterized protein n=1 Tax=Didymella heteroderae TaxID=1769908 RepID=A0A9P4WGS4_9PLEO|nr:hypothetical protein E8E12_000947 [Didymella heteroderae]